MGEQHISISCREPSVSLCVTPSADGFSRCSAGKLTSPAALTLCLCFCDCATEISLEYFQKIEQKKDKTTAWRLNVAPLPFVLLLIMRKLFALCPERFCFRDSFLRAYSRHGCNCTREEEMKKAS